VEKDNIILNKSFDFAVDVYHFTKKLKENKEFEIANQLFRSGTSIGANAQEAVGGISKKDFVVKMSISYKEARETLYWLNLCEAVGLQIGEVEVLKVKAQELAKILSSIIKTSKSNF